MTERAAEHVAHLLAGAAAHERLSGGTYNTVYRLRLADGTRLVLKVPPPDDVPAMTYERALLHGEAAFFRAAGAAGMPGVPEVRELADGFLLMTECPGRPWHEVASDGGLAPADRARLRRELGRLVGRLHAITGPSSRFGYPGEAGGALPVAGDWRGAFTAMLDAALADVARYGAWLPVPLHRVRALAAAAAPALAAVTTPALVHFDLWEGNVLLDGGRISGLIDGERMFWGDPLAEFASLNLFGGPEDDPDLLAGYAAAGGCTAFDDAAHVRMALYRCYLYVIMLTEVQPRAYGPEQVAWARREAGGALRAAVDVLAAA